MYLEGYRWKPSASARREFAQKMQEIDDFCRKNNIHQSSSGDSYYFTLNGRDYRISNHTVAASNRGAYDDEGNQVRGEYHPEGEEEGTTYITASKTRIIDIYNDLKNGYKLDRRGNRLNEDYDYFDYKTEDIVDNKYIDATKSEMTYYQEYLDEPEETNKYHKTSSKIVEMAPREYFEECAKIFDSTFEKQYRQIELDSQVIDKLKTVVLNLKKKFPIVVLNYAENTQEGRHRMFVLGELFGWDEKYPVLIIYPTEEGKQEARHNEIYKALREISNKALQYTYTSFDNFMLDLKYMFEDKFNDYIDTYLLPNIVETKDNITVSFENTVYYIEKYEVKIDPNKDTEWDDMLDDFDIDDILNDPEYQELLK